MAVSQKLKVMDICLAPVWRLPRRSVLSSSRSMHFGDVSETNGHVTQKASAARSIEA